MLPPDLLKLLSVVAPALDQVPQPKVDILRTDLTDAQYADWFLDNKIEKGRTNPEHFLNDFVLFRVALQWPRGAMGWSIEAGDLVDADFSLSEQDALDLVSMAREGLTDGYTSAAWYAKVSAMRYVVSNESMPEVLFEFLQEALFLPPSSGSGRKKTDGMDRDRIIRNVVEGLLARNMDQPAAITNARAIAVAALGRKGVSITEDGIRKVCGRSTRSNREARLWALLAFGKSLESKG